ncbi:hypothetical protein AQJ30_27615 [Streptomyces longwoodensis]|uniref:Uncharacterized protein n=1 Tax=Streptomyces longwoodensis TaxID=68231 RepID=A0A117QLF3_9ACTN|nr:hypothetical protein [Streptomyces longwoodensis]KUN34839.1 hypothetical protein AQJ30_27615 [Streptomyces longwoodensis]
MPRQIDQLPPDATTLARKVRALEEAVRELRAARRLSSATLGLVQTAPDGDRVALDQRSKSLKVYGPDGETVLAELGPTSDGGGGLWTRGNQPIPFASTLSSGELAFRPVQNGVVQVPGKVYYDTEGYQYSDLTLTSGAVSATDHRALLILESLYAGQTPYVYVQGENSTQCNLDVLGVVTAQNIAYGQVTITPSAANTPTSANISGLGLKGSAFYGVATAATSAVGTSVTGVGVTGVSANGLNVWLTRSSTTATTVYWIVMGS